jgi:hypothetical protein
VTAPVLRIDAVTVHRQDAEVTPEGFHLFAAHYARTGNQDYDDGRGGIITEYRPDTEVFSDESLASYDLRPLTDLHPPRNVTTDTARMLARGAVSAGKRHADGVHVAGRLAVWDGPLIKKFLDAFARGDAMQLSAGYELDLDHTPGTAPDGRRYDAVQRNIRINHVAAVPLGRAGTARVLADSFANEWAKFDSAQYVLDGARSYADIAPNRDRVIVDFGQRWARHDAASLRIQSPKADAESSTMKKITIKVDGQDVALEYANDEQLAALVSKAHADAAVKRDAASKAAQDQAIADAVAKAKQDAMAPPFGKKPEEEEEAKKDAAHRDELAKVRADADVRIDVLSKANAVHGLTYDGARKTVDCIRLDVIETVATRTERDGAALRKELEATAADEKAGAIAYAYRQALKDFAALPGHHDNLLSTIRGANQVERKRDGKPDPIHEARDAATRTAAMTPTEREAARKAG